MKKYNRLICLTALLTSGGFYSAPSVSKDISKFDLHADNVRRSAAVTIKAKANLSLIKMMEDLLHNQNIKIKKMKNFLPEIPPISERDTHLMLRYCDSDMKLQWGDCSTYKIGGMGQAGGIVFYVSDDGKHGLEIAPTDAGSFLWGIALAEWGCLDSYVGSTQSSIGTGKSNTDRILQAKCDKISGHAMAAEMATNFSINGYSDWYLPSIDELKLMYDELQPKKDKTHRLYWSSTESDSQYADGIDSNHGIPKDHIKGAKYRVWPIRNF